jgi:maleylpyruvate isomerase
MTSSVPVDVIEHVSDAQRRFNTTIEDLDDDAVRRDSRLPGWSVAHVIAHVSRNADSHVRRAEAASRGEVVEQYAGGYAGRAAEIEAAARHPAAALIADARSSAEQLAIAWAAVPEAAWTAVTVDVGGRERALAELPSRRWQELEVHVIDLRLGVTHRDWSDDFVAAWLPRLRASLSQRLTDGARPPADGTLDARDELAWLYGRLRRDDLPTLAPWG